MPQEFGHWTPSYFLNKFRFKLYVWKHPDQPWLTKAANDFLSSWIQGDDVGLEWGSGHSTAWFAQRSRHVTSIESNEEWYSLVHGELSKKGLVDKADLRLIKTSSGEMQDGVGESYVTIAESMPDAYFDYILVDGMCRSSCALVAIKKLKPGGLLIIDNINWFLPSHSRSPSSRTIKMGALSSKWQEFHDLICGWRNYWTSNGVTDTTIWQKPFL